MIFLLFLFLFFSLGCESHEETPERDFAEQWIRANVKTFTERGGSNLEHVESKEIDEGMYDVMFEFDSALSGYGQLFEDEVSAQVITPHVITITVVIEDEKVIKAVTDGRYDEIEEKLIAVIINNKVITEEEINEYIRQVARDHAEENLSSESLKHRWLLLL